MSAWTNDDPPTSDPARANPPACRWPEFRHHPLRPGARPVAAPTPDLPAATATGGADRQPPDDDDALAPARGILVGLPLAGLLWAVAGGLVALVSFVIGFLTGSGAR